MERELEIPPEKISAKIAELTGFSDRWIRENLPSKYKMKAKAREIREAPKEEFAEVSSAKPKARKAPLVYCEGQIRLMEAVDKLTNLRDKELNCDKCQLKEVCGKIRDLIASLPQ